MSKPRTICELAALAIFAAAIILIGLPLAGEHPLAQQGVIWLANVTMVVTVWLGLKLRGQGWSHLGLQWRIATRRVVLRAVLQSLIVFVAAIAAFMVGAIVMVNILGRPQPADMSQYNFLRGNLHLLVLSLAAVYVGSSFAEEVIYRGYLVTRLAEFSSGGRRGTWGAVAISSIVFGLVHYAWGPAGMVQTGCMGVALAASYLLVKRKLWVTILAHAYLDTILLTQLYFAPAPNAAH